MSDRGTRADLSAIFADRPAGTHVYTCGPDSYMAAVTDAAQAAGLPEDACHLEYFAVPEIPEYENHAFRIELNDGRVLDVPPEMSAAEVLIASGVPVDLKCSDGLCGVCQCGLLDGEAEHRDFVLSKAQREKNIILCQSRAAHKDGTLKLDL